MKAHRTRVWSLVVFASLAIATAPLRGAPAWWNYEWKCRRPVTLPKSEPTRLGGDDIAVVHMPTGGKMRPDASDIRVTTITRREMPSRVLMTGPGDEVRVAFAIQAGVTQYFVYYGNPNPPQQARKLAIRRGVLLSEWKFPGGSATTLDKARAVLKKVDTFIGRDFLDRIFLGHSPFGPTQAVTRTFEAYLKVPKTGTYIFSTSSQNASFLTLDDKLVVANGGNHGPQRDIRKRGQAYLKAGVHKLTFYHCSPWGAPVAVVAWQPPREKRMRVIPPGAFAPVVRGQAGAMEEIGKAAVDFTPVHAGEAFMANRYYQRYSFQAVQTGSAVGKQVVEWTWDFGDGERATGAAVEHVYFLDAMRTVTLTGLTRTGTLVRTNTIYVTRPWRTVTHNRLDSLRDHAAIVAKYRFKKLDSLSMVEAVNLLKRTGRIEGLLKVGAAFVARGSADKKAAAYLVPIYAEALLAAGQADTALKALLAGAKLETYTAGRAELLVRAGQVCVEHLSDARKGMALFSEVVSKYGALSTSIWVRRARIGIGDVWRLTGEQAKARTAYAAAGTRSVRKGGGQALTRGDFARQIEDYIRRRDLEAAANTLDKWADALPADKLDGYWSLLRARMLVRKKSYLVAAREAEILVRVTPTSHHAPELLMLAADAYRQAGKPIAADATLKRVLTEYAESTLAAKAAALLKGE